MEETTTSGGERRVVYYYYDYICRCKCFQGALRALFKCLGLDSETTTPTDHVCSSPTTPLIMSTSDHGHKDQEDDQDQAATGIDDVVVIVYADDKKPATNCHHPASGSSSSSSSSSGDEHTMGDLPTSSDPTPTSTDDPTSDPAVLAVGGRRAPPRPPVTSGRGGQTN